MERLAQVPIAQKKVLRRPHEKLSEFLVGLLSGMEHLTDLSEGPAPLARDRQVAIAWKLQPMADASGVSRTLRACDAEAVQGLADVLEAVSQPFLERAVNDLRQRSETLFRDADLTGRRAGGGLRDHPRADTCLGPGDAAGDRRHGIPTHGCYGGHPWVVRPVCRSIRETGLWLLIFGPDKPVRQKLRLDVVGADGLDPDLLATVLALCNRAYEEEPGPLFATFVAAVHVLGFLGNELVSHARWVTRWLKPGDGPRLRTAYVEGELTFLCLKDLTFKTKESSLVCRMHTACLSSRSPFSRSGPIGIQPSIASSQRMKRLTS